MLADSSISPPLDSPTVTYLQSSRNGNYSNVVALTILVYHTILVFPDEVKYIWKTRWSIPKVFYIFVRYYGIIHNTILLMLSTHYNVSRQSCQAYYWMTSIGGPVAIYMVTNTLMAMRIHALYQCNPILLCTLIFFLLTEATVGIFNGIKTSIITSSGIVPFVSPNMPIAIPGCITLREPISGVMLSPLYTYLGTSTIFFMLTMYKLLETCYNLAHPVKKGSLIFLLFGRHFLAPLHVAFLRDGVVNYFTIIIVLLVSTFIYSMSLPLLGQVPTPWLVGVYSFSGANLVLGLRKVAAEDVDASLNTGLSPMNFTQHTMDNTTLHLV